MKSESYWQTKSKRVPRTPLLQKDIETDVLVIGGGITGLTTALLLRRAGQDVVLLERGTIGNGDTGQTTAHLTYMTDTRLTDLVSTLGEDHALASWDAGAAAMQQIRELAVADECDLRVVPGFLVASRTVEDLDQDRQQLEKEAHLAIKHGFDVAHMDAVPPTGRPGIRFANQFKIHPIKYLRGLASQALSEGVQIFEGAEVREFLDDSLCAKVGSHAVHFEKVVIATHMPLQGMSGTLPALLLQTKLFAYSTYAIQATAESGAYPEMIWSDTAKPFHYLRCEKEAGHDVLIFGGQDHRTGQVTETEECYRHLVQELSWMCPLKSVERRWSGQVIETPDGLPYIGAAGEHQYIATGFSGNGLTYGTLAAMMIRDEITGKSNPWKALFDPERKKLAAIWDYVRENSDYPYYLAKDYATGTEGDSLADVQPDEGKILRLNGKRMAVYRSLDGKISRCSAICPHLGCIVHWNVAERTWDCPCHGSRFCPDGKLLAGPAETDLAGGV